MAEIVTSALLYYIFYVGAISLIRPINSKVLIFSMVYLAGLITLATVNFEYNLIEQKFASTFSYERFIGEQTRLNGNFLFQAIVSAAAFAFTDNWIAAIGVNVATIAALPLFADRMRLAYLAIFLAPGTLHISIFALRDVLIAATLFLFCYLALNPSRPRLLLGIGLTALLAMQRPELAAVVGVTLIAIKFRDFGAVQKSALVVGTILITVVLLPKVPVIIGLPPAKSIFELPDIIMNFSQIRADRWTETDGANSAILAGRLTSIPILLRVPIQFLAFFLSPLPVDFKGFASVVFLLDSMIFIWLFVVFWRRADRRIKIFLMAYIAANAFFMANYANLFRLRMPCFFIIYAGLIHHVAQSQAAIGKQRLAALRLGWRQAKARARAIP